MNTTEQEMIDQLEKKWKDMDDRTKYLVRNIEYIKREYVRGAKPIKLKKFKPGVPIPKNVQPFDPTKDKQLTTSNWEGA
jgi:hypothetical protein